ncbi:MAG: chemotaxis protein CheB [Myxococcota bacterium]
MTASFRVLVVDDSPTNRVNISNILQTDPRLVVAARAGDGQEAIRAVNEYQPDVITLDLEMPRMDGFTFLRILQSSRPTPVIVVSTDSRPHSVFQALELGAVDFVVKPVHGGVTVLHEAADELRDKVLASALYAGRLTGNEVVQEKEITQARRSGIKCVAVAASTGGPPVVQAFLESFSEPPPFSIVVAQHMPARFTEALAERLAKRMRFPVAELKQAEKVVPGRAYICPGGLITAVKNVGNDVVARLSPPAAERYSPSADILLTSVAEVFKTEAAAVVCTGMGNDGAEGAQKVERVGGRVFVEAPQTAVLPTMPQATLDACATARPMRKDALCRYFSNAAKALAAQQKP